MFCPTARSARISDAPPSFFPQVVGVVDGMKPVAGIGLLVAFEIVGLTLVYLSCKTLAWLGAGQAVFPTWLIGVPVAFIGAVAASLALCRRL